MGLSIEISPYTRYKSNPEAISSDSVLSTESQQAFGHECQPRPRAGLDAFDLLHRMNCAFLFICVYERAARHCRPRILPNTPVVFDVQLAYIPGKHQWPPHIVGESQLRQQHNIHCVAISHPVMLEDDIERCRKGDQISQNFVVTQEFPMIWKTFEKVF